MHTVRQSLNAIFFACALSTLVLFSFARSQVVMSQLFGGGGNSGSPLRNDFVELFNQGEIPVSIEGWTVQYASASGSSWQSAALTGIIMPRHWFLICLPGGTSGGDPLPAADDSGAFGMSASSGKLALLDSAVQLSGSCPSSSHIVDFVGWGSASCFKGSGTAPGTSNTTAAVRKDSGMASEGDNATDFVSAPPHPRNSANTPLSIQLASLEAVALKEGGVRISWTTYSELNNFGFFVLRRSMIDSGFVELSESFQSGFGTSIERHDYHFIDTGGNAACRYRLKQVDLDGSNRLTESISVASTNGVAMILARPALHLCCSPNPFNPASTITCIVPQGSRGMAFVRLRVFDVLGRPVVDLLNGYVPSGTYKVRFDGSHQSSGFYVCRLEADVDGVTLVRSTSMILLR